MEDNILFFTAIFTAILLSGFNIFYFIKGKLKYGSLEKKFSWKEFFLLIFIAILICFISKLKYQVDALLISLVLYLMPLAEINFEIFLEKKRIELILSSLVFCILIFISIYLLIHGFL